VQPAVTDSTIDPSIEAKAVMTKLSRSFMTAIAILSVAGVVISAVSLQRHYAKSATSYCEFGQQFNCDIVNRSEYSSITGIPVAAIGIAGYGLLFTLSTLYRSRRETATRLPIFALVGMAFALYLTYIEAHVLNTWCILCLISLGLITIITALAAVMKLRLAQNH